ncbi:hypothetical protein CBNA_1771 [Coxiella burnetii str. Namibia]|nr:hypothetical protein CBNA_1771 [Coxiella burnetii str. Namibia]
MKRSGIRGIVIIPRISLRSYGATDVVSDSILILSYHSHLAIKASAGGSGPSFNFFLTLIFELCLK